MQNYSMMGLFQKYRPWIFIYWLVLTHQINNVVTHQENYLHFLKIGSNSTLFPILFPKQKFSFSLSTLLTQSYNPKKRISWKIGFRPFHINGSQEQCHLNNASWSLVMFTSKYKFFSYLLLSQHGFLKLQLLFFLFFTYLTLYLCTRRCL